MSTRTVLVTGAGRGIGRAIAVRLARSGWRVYAGVRNDVAARELSAVSDLITPVELDVTVSEHLAALDGELPGRLDALVNNVGIAVPGPLETLSRSDIHHQFDVNLFGPLALTRALLPRLRQSRGRVVFISSINGRVSFPFTGIYNASKYATEAVADCLRVELGPFGVQVGLVAPGVIDTDPWREMDQILDDVEAGLDPEHRALYAPHFAGERQLVGKIRKGAKPPELVAAAVERQLDRRRMRPRMLVGADARLILAMKAILPARGLDAVWSRGLGLGVDAGEQEPAGGASGEGDVRHPVPAALVCTFPDSTPPSPELRAEAQSQRSARTRADPGCPSTHCAGPGVCRSTS